jgi:aryl-alcohol dehydrogenase-like predicted oxidoreductase
MVSEFRYARLRCATKPVLRLGLSASYWPGKRAIHRALDSGVNYFFLYGFDFQMIRVLREALRGRREQYVVATGAYNYIWGRQNLRKTLEKRLRQLRTDYIDLFHFLGIMKGREFPPQVEEELRALRETGLVRGVAVSCHDRRFAGQLAARGAVDALMIRYNAAHPGAERDIFPHLATRKPHVVAYTATSWRKLLKRPRGWDGNLMTAVDCYRFCLSSQHVDITLTGPANETQLDDNLKAIAKGPLAPDEMTWMRAFGQAVHG